MARKTKLPKKINFLIESFEFSSDVEDTTLYELTMWDEDSQQSYIFFLTATQGSLGHALGYAGLNGLQLIKVINISMAHYQLG